MGIGPPGALAISVSLMPSGDVWRYSGPSSWADARARLCAGDALCWKAIFTVPCPRLPANPGRNRGSGVRRFVDERLHTLELVRPQKNARTKQRTKHRRPLAGPLRVAAGPSRARRSGRRRPDPTLRLRICQQHRGFERRIESGSTYVAGVCRRIVCALRRFDVSASASIPRARAEACVAQPHRED